jgi:ATP-dependent Clp protease ATP-binding subunit ClpA
MFERYEDEAKRAVFFAHFEATHREESCISARDLLVGLTWEANSRACQVGLLKEKAVALRAAVGIPHRPSTAHVYKTGVQIPLDDDGKKTLAYAVQEVEHDKQWWLGSDHLLRALLRFPNPAAQALEACGLQLEALRAASRENRKVSPPKPTPKGAYFKATAKKYWPWVALLMAAAIFAYLKLQG